MNVRPITQVEAEEQELVMKNGVVFIDKITHGSIPREYIPSYNMACEMRLFLAFLADTRWLMFAVNSLMVHTTKLTQAKLPLNKQAPWVSGKRAPRQVLALLEPIMKVIITTPDEFFGSVSGDLSSRRGQINDSELRGVVRIINAEVPLSEMFGYTTVLRGMTQGRASSTMEPAEYRLMPENLKKEVLKA